MPEITDHRSREKKEKEGDKAVMALKEKHKGKKKILLTLEDVLEWAREKNS